MEWWISVAHLFTINAGTAYGLQVYVPVCCCGCRCGDDDANTSVSGCRMVR